MVSFRRIVPIALLSAALSPLHAQLQQTEPAIASGPYRIAGTAVDAKSGSPLSHAYVQIMDAKKRQETQSYLTSSDGRFEFHVPAGKYGLSAAKRGFIPTSYNQHGLFSTGIVTGAGLDTESLVLRVMPEAIISGKIIDENGEPVRSGGITIYRQNNDAGISRIDQVQSANTDDQGTYEAANLQPGTYFVGVKASAWYEVHPATAIVGPSAPPSVDQSLDVVYPTTYYGDVTEADEATPIPVRSGDRLEADIRLTPVPALHLLFNVPEDGHHGINVPTLEKSVFGQMEGVPNNGVQQVSPGVYEMTGVPPGSYMVTMPNSGGQPQAPMVFNLSSSQELSGVGGSPTAKVEFTVAIQGSRTLPNGLFIGLRDSKGQVTTMPVDANGKAEIENVIAGQYVVVAGSRNGLHTVAGMSWGGQQRPGRQMTIAPGAILDASITLISGSVTVEGIAKRGEKPFPAAMIVLVPKDPEKNQDLFRRDQSDSDGTFSLLNVVPGSYKVIAIEDGWDLDWAKPAVLARYSRNAQVLNVPANNRNTVHLPTAVEVEKK